MNLPAFLCVGSQKAGTTTLHDVLLQHPGIYLPEIKETKFFMLNSKYDQGLDYYSKAFFKGVKKGQLVGEIDPEYMYFDYVPQRIYESLGKDIKLIFIMRNPAARAYSQYLMAVKRAREDLDFYAAIEQESERIRIDDSQSQAFSKKDHLSYMDRGHYAAQIKRYLEYFPKENMKFILFENDFIKNQQQTFKEVLEFLGVEPFEFDLSRKSNVAQGQKSKFLGNLVYGDHAIRRMGKRLLPSADFRKKILGKLAALNVKEIENTSLTQDEYKSLNQQYFLEDIKELEKIIGRDLTDWYQ